LLELINEFNKVPVSKSQHTKKAFHTQIMKKKLKKAIPFITSIKIFRISFIKEISAMKTIKH
jgi:hypothetical protein